VQQNSPETQRALVFVLLSFPSAVDDARYFSGVCPLLVYDNHRWVTDPAYQIPLQLSNITNRPEGG
jgi:hypothetical protein